MPWVRVICIPLLQWKVLRNFHPMPLCIGGKSVVYSDLKLKIYLITDFHKLREGKSTYQNTSPIQPSVSPLLTHNPLLQPPFMHPPKPLPSHGWLLWLWSVHPQPTSCHSNCSVRIISRKTPIAKSGAWYAYFLPRPARVRVLHVTFEAGVIPSDNPRLRTALGDDVLILDCKTEAGDWGEPGPT